jgi:hypothetical protein
MRFVQTPITLMPQGFGAWPQSRIRLNARAQAMVTLYEAALARISNPIELLWGED